MNLRQYSMRHWSGRAHRAVGRIFGALLILADLSATQVWSAEPANVPDGQVSARSFVDQSQIVSNYTTEQYAHQCSMRIVKGMGYVAYQCNETTTAENAAGQVVRMAIFNILNPTATAKWVDVSGPGDASNGIAIGGTFVASPILHAVGDDTIRVFFSSRLAGDSVPIYRVFYKDYRISTGVFSGLHQVGCTIAKTPGTVRDLALPAVQMHLDFLFGRGFGEQFAKGLNPACDMLEFDGHLYSTIQIKNSSEGKTLLMTNVLMRSANDGATWELLGAPDPRLLPGDAPDAVKILAEPAMTQDSKSIYLHLRSNVTTHGYVLSKASKTDLYSFDAPVTKWTYGIGRPAIGDFGKPIGVVAMFTAPSVPMGGTTVTRNKCDVVLIDRTYSTYTLAFSVVDYNAVNTPFIHRYNDELYVAYSTGRRRLTPRFGTSEIVFSKLRREFFIGPESPEP